MPSAHLAAAAAALGLLDVRHFWLARSYGGVDHFLLSTIGMTSCKAPNAAVGVSEKQARRCRVRMGAALSAYHFGVAHNLSSGVSRLPDEQTAGGGRCGAIRVMP